jgi:hypothetical protein
LRRKLNGSSSAEVKQAKGRPSDKCFAVFSFGDEGVPSLLKKSLEVVDPQLWGGAMRCQKTRSKDFFRSNVFTRRVSIVKCVAASGAAASVSA